MSWKWEISQNEPLEAGEWEKGEEEGQEFSATNYPGDLEQERKNVLFRTWSNDIKSLLKATKPHSSSSQHNTSEWNILTFIKPNLKLVTS